MERPIEQDRLHEEAQYLWEGDTQHGQSGPVATKSPQIGSISRSVDELGSELSDLLMLRDVHQEFGMPEGTGDHLWWYLFGWGTRELAMRISRLTDPVRARQRYPSNSLVLLLKNIEERQAKGYLTREEYIRLAGGEKNWQAELEKSWQEEISRASGPRWGLLKGQRGEMLNKVFDTRFGVGMNEVEQGSIEAAKELLKTAEILELRELRDKHLAHTDYKAYAAKDPGVHIVGFRVLEGAWESILRATKRLTELAFLDSPGSSIGTAQFDHGEQWFGPRVPRDVSKLMYETTYRRTARWNLLLDGQEHEEN